MTNVTSRTMLLCYQWCATEYPPGCFREICTCERTNSFKQRDPQQQKTFRWFFWFLYSSSTFETAWSRRHLRILHLIIAASPPDSVSFARSSRFFRTNSRIICLSSANGNMWHKCRFPEIGVPLVIIHFHQIFNSKPASYWVSPCTVLLLLFLSLDRISVPFLMNSPSLRVSVFASSAYTQLARLVQLSYTR